MLGQSAPQGVRTEQLPAETVQAVVLPLHTPADAPSSVEGVQLQSQTGQLAGETMQSSLFLLQTPADAPSKSEGVQLQVPQGGRQSLSTVWVCVLGGGHEWPPQAARVRTSRDLVLLRSPFTQALQGDHSLQGPHTQIVGGRVPVAL